MKKVWYVLSMALILLIASCQSDNPSMITLGLDDTYVVERMKGLTLHLVLPENDTNGLFLTSPIRYLSPIRLWRRHAIIRL